MAKARTFVTAAALVSAVPLAAQSLMPDQHFSTLSVEALAADIHPVAGSDDRTHLAYELVISNPSNLHVTIDRVDAVDPSGRTIESLAGDGLAKMTTRYAGDGNRLAPGQSAVVFMDVIAATEVPLPDHLRTKVTVSRHVEGNDGALAPLPPGGPLQAAASFVTAPIKVSTPARRIAAPLRGDRWVAVNGCCDSITSHRGAVIAIDGKRNAPERFAIDWVRLDEAGRLFTGDGHRIDSFPFYGVPIYAVADGTVVNTFDGLDEQVPLEPAKGLTPAGIGGNMMVVDIGGGAYAFYAHLQRGSLKAKVGDRVKEGQVLGLLGNTGNTDAPHLHFHLMDGPVPLASNGLPFVIDHFTSEGALETADLDALFDGKPVVPRPARRGHHVDRMPLNNDVTDFGAD